MPFFSIGLILESVFKKRNMDFSVNTQYFAIRRNQGSTVEVEVGLCFLVDGSDDIDALLLGDTSHSLSGGPRYTLCQVEESVVELAGEILGGEKLLKTHQLRLMLLHGGVDQLFRLAEVVFLGLFTGRLNSGNSHIVSLFRDALYKVAYARGGRHLWLATYDERKCRNCLIP